MIRTLIASLFLLPFAGTGEDLARADLDQRFHEANIAHADGRFEEAKELYLEIQEEADSPNLQYNLGATYDALGNPGRAIYHYTRSWVEDPSHPDTLKKIGNVLSRRGQTAPDYPGWLLEKVPMRYPLWLTFAVLGGWLIAGGATGILIRRKSGGGPFLFILCGVFLGILGSLGVLEYQERFKIGVIESENTLLRVAPTTGSPGEGQLQPGDWVSIKKDEGSFFAVETASGQQGYLLQEEVLSLPFR